MLATVGAPLASTGNRQNTRATRAAALAFKAAAYHIMTGDILKSSMELSYSDFKPANLSVYGRDVYGASSLVNDTLIARFGTFRTSSRGSSGYSVVAGQSEGCCSGRDQLVMSFISARL